jgi:hypothetical protein
VHYGDFLLPEQRRHVSWLRAVFRRTLLFFHSYSKPTKVLRTPFYCTSNILVETGHEIRSHNVSPMASVFPVGVSQLEVLDQGQFAALPSYTPECLADSFIAGTADRPCCTQQEGMHRMAVEALFDYLP